MFTLEWRLAIMGAVGFNASNQRAAVLIRGLTCGGDFDEMQRRYMNRR